METRSLEEIQAIPDEPDDYKIVQIRIMGIDVTAFQQFLDDHHGLILEQILTAANVDFVRENINGKMLPALKGKMYVVTGMGDCTVSVYKKKDKEHFKRKEITFYSDSKSIDYKIGLDKEPIHYLPLKFPECCFIIDPERRLIIDKFL